MRCTCFLTVAWCLGFIGFTIAPSIVGLHCLVGAIWCSKEGPIYGTILLIIALTSGGLFTVWCVWRHFKLRNQKRIEQDLNDVALDDDEVVTKSEEEHDEQLIDDEKLRHLYSITGPVKH